MRQAYQGGSRIGNRRTTRIGNQATVHAGSDGGEQIRKC